MRKTPLILLVFTLFTALLFQGCTKGLFFSSGENSEYKSQGNGDGYSGKPDPYEFRNPEQVCVEKGANGIALPNALIFIFPDGRVQLVREQCADIIPKTLSSQDYTRASNGDIIYQNQSFASNLNQSSFDVVAASCPAGKTLLSNPVRTNFATDSLDLLSPYWENQGLVVTLEGSLASLPVYKLERQDPNKLAFWHRLAQNYYLTAGENYVYSFFIKKDSTEKAKFISFSPNNFNLQIQFDLLSGAANVDASTGVAQISTNTQVVSNGLYINIYFQALTEVQVNTGVTPLGEVLGSAISTTAIQLEKLSNFCSP